MATVQLESFCLIRSSQHPPIAASSLSCRPITARFPPYTGLKQRPLAAISFRSQFASRVGSRGGRVLCEARDTAAVEVASITDENWQSLVIESETPVLVEFWAPWCGPCRMMHPLIDELAKEYVGKFKCYKLNTDESPSTATRYGVRSIPTVIFFKDGEKKDAIIGAVPKASLITNIEKFL
ncbi:thioredoxin M4, chloroplastic-like [Vicia villosa]|uniref:thioredoxin M4, chloroplastic-like n=1 Tax=Vicia villosa TaxID=3911 RepID=UPI00273ACB17|nr:thioredoxin M4, chloroplastic-like [Vicia villosa]XP_058779578.1 thioredoxin M4, chloroplastic-like [Vicia villosa]